jgi:hypothetical protein
MASPPSHELDPKSALLSTVTISAKNNLRQINPASKWNCQDGQQNGRTPSLDRLANEFLTSSGAASILTSLVRPTRPCSRIHVWWMAFTEGFPACAQASSGATNCPNVE